MSFRKHRMFSWCWLCSFICTNEKKNLCQVKHIYTHSNISVNVLLLIQIAKVFNTNSSCAVALMSFLFQAIFAYFYRLCETQTEYWQQQRREKKKHWNTEDIRSKSSFWNPFGIVNFNTFHILCSDFVCIPNIVAAIPSFFLRFGLLFLIFCFSFGFTLCSVPRLLSITSDRMQS